LQLRDLLFEIEFEAEIVNLLFSVLSFYNRDSCSVLLMSESAASRIGDCVRTGKQQYVLTKLGYDSSSVHGFCTSGCCEPLVAHRWMSWIRVLRY